MNLVQQLYQLQELDLERDKQRRRLKEILGQLGETEEMRSARAERERIQAELGIWRTRRQDLELETRSLETKIASVEERLYSGRVTNPKELTDLQKDLASLRKQRGALDEKSLEAMVAIEENETTLNKTQAALSALETAWSAQQHSLKQERAELEAQLAQLDKTRADHTRGIPPNHLARYESLRRDKNGIALACIEDGFCGVCGVELSDRTLTQAVQDDSLVFCGNCERILME
jgi:predicted  nucleic acid-binding Zn-ribbon protein